MKIIISGNLKDNIPEFYLQTFSMLFFPEDNIFGKNAGENLIEICAAENKNGIDISVKICYNKTSGEKSFKCSISHENCESAENTDGRSRFKKGLLIEIGRAFFETAEKLTGIKPPWGIYTGIRPAKTAGNIIEENGGDIRAAISVLREKYLIDEKKAEIAADTYINAKNIIAGNSPGRRDYDYEYKHEKEFSLYISIPFCPSRCRYCSFVSYATPKLLKLIPEYIEKLTEELRDISKAVKEQKLILRTVYIGGGTPTVLDGDRLRTVLEEVRRRFDFADVAEYTVEAGRPDTITAEKLSLLKECGVDRISINPQTLNDDILTKIGRRHNSGDFFEAYSAARKTGIKNINADCIIGLDGEDGASMIRTVKKLIELEPENITVHTLCVKRSSEMKADGNAIIYRPYAPEVNNAMEEIYSALCENNYLPYYMYKQKYSVGNLENTGFGKKNRECLYNIYMMDELHTIFGAGAGATTKIVYPDGRIERRINNKYPYEYLK